MNKGGIYQILNTENGKCYVGQAVDLHKRKRVHFSNLNNGKHHSTKLQRSWDKYGADCFVFEVLEYIEDRDLLMAAEQKWINELKAFGNGYNIQPFACRGCYGMNIPPEVRAKTSATMKGRKYSAERVEKAASVLRGRKLSPEHIAKFRNRKLSPEHIASLVAANTGRHPSEETRQKLRAWQIGKTISNEQRAKISATLTGRKTPEEVIAKLRGRKHSTEEIAKRVAANTGRKRSAESRMKMSIAQKGRTFTDETRERMSAAQKRFWAEKRSLAA